MTLRRIGLTLLGLVGMLALVSAAPVKAAEMTLEDCVTLALKTRASIIQARGSEQVAGAEKRSALGAFLPSLSARYSWSESKQYDVPVVDSLGAPTGQTTTFTSSGKSLTFSSGMSLFDLGNFFSYAAAHAASERSHLDVLASEQDLIYAVKLAFYTHLTSVDNVSVQEEAVKRSDEQLKLIQSKFDLGSASKSDVLKQQVLSGNDKLALLKAQNAVITSRADLAFTIGMDPASDVEFTSTKEMTPFDGTLDDAIKYGLEHRPEVLAAEKDLSVAKSNVGAARSQYLPNISGSADYSLRDPDFNDKSLSYGFSINWSIFDGFRREQQITSAKVSRNNSMAGLADARNAAVQDIKSAYLNIEQLKQQRDVATANVASATEDLKITQEKYNLGAATILDLLNAQVSLKQAETDLVGANFDLNVATAKLENAMGKQS